MYETFDFFVNLNCHSRVGKPTCGLVQASLNRIQSANISKGYVPQIVLLLSQRRKVIFKRNITTKEQIIEVRSRTKFEVSFLCPLVISNLL